jgi:hypothetical protein
VTQVRFLPPQLEEKKRALGRAAKVPAFQAGKAGSTPAGHLRERSSEMLGDRLTVGCLSLKQAMKVRILLPEPLTSEERP